jgi:hypothetical protein
VCVSDVSVCVVREKRERKQKIEKEQRGCEKVFVSVCVCVCVILMINKIVSFLFPLL